MMADGWDAGTSDSSKDLAENLKCKFDAELAIHNMPKHKSHKELKKYLTSLGLKPRRVQINFDHAYVTFADEADLAVAATALNGHRWKGKLLRAKRAKGVEGGMNPESRASPKHPVPTHKSHSEIADEKAIDWRAAVIHSTTPLADQSYDQQLKMKQQESYKLLKKISWEIRKCSDIQPNPGQHYYGELEEIKPSPVLDGYRNKCEFTVGLGPDGKAEVGFLVSRFRPGSCTVVSAEYCRHVPDMVKRAVVRFRDYLRSDACFLPVYNVESKEGFWRMLTAKFFKLDLMLVVTVSEKSFSSEVVQRAKKQIAALFFDLKDRTPDPKYRVNSLFWSAAEFHSETPSYERILGAPFLYEYLLNCRFRISPGTFFQTNSAGCSILYRILVDYLKSLNRGIDTSRMDCNAQKSGTLLFDVCCGVGSIGICASDYVRKVIGIEVIEQAVADAKINALCNEKLNCEFVAGRAEDIFLDLQRQKLIDFDAYEKIVAILDPPRKGLGDKVISCLRQCSYVTSVIYVSCDPRGASKNFLDLCRRPSKRYSGLAFDLKRVIPVDLFPHTNHFEWVMFFERPLLSVVY